MKVEYEGYQRNDYVYVLEKYPFYEGSSIILISQDYTMVKDAFDKEWEHSSDGYGYCIKKYHLDTLYGYDKKYKYGETMLWLEKDYDGKTRTINRGQ